MGRKKEGLVPLPFRVLFEAQGVVLFAVFFFGCKVCALPNDVGKGSSLIYSIYTVVQVDG